jgi:hypothetical protein
LPPARHFSDACAECKLRELLAAHARESRLAREKAQMARPGFEPGTPRFSGIKKATEKPADLQDVPE